MIVFSNVVEISFHTIFQSMKDMHILFVNATEHVYPLQMHHGKPTLSITSTAQLKLKKKKKKAY